MGSATILGMFGGFSGSWGGVASGRQDVRWNGMMRRSGSGRRSAGQRLKKARNEGRTIVFVDESGLSERPNRYRTWSLRGQTPVLQYHFNWKSLSAIAGVTWWRFYFRLYPGAIKSPQIIEFLKRLRRQVPGPLLVVWDGLPSHRSRLVREFVADTEGALVLERLPAYAPELNPVEYLWGYWKHHELPNFRPKDFGQLSHHVWKQASLF